MILSSAEARLIISGDYRHRNRHSLRTLYNDAVSRLQGLTCRTPFPAFVHPGISEISLYGVDFMFLTDAYAVAEEIRNSGVEVFVIQDPDIKDGNFRNRMLGLFGLTT